MKDTSKLERVFDFFEVSSSACFLERRRALFADICAADVAEDIFLSGRRQVHRRTSTGDAFFCVQLLLLERSHDAFVSKLR